MNSDKSLNRSHNLSADTPARHGGRPNVARDAGRGKAVYDVAIHNGMSTQSKSGPAFGGDHKSALDSLSGQATVPGKPGAAATAHPLTAPSVTKNLAPVKPTPGHRSRVDPDFARALFDDAAANPKGSY